MTDTAASEWVWITHPNLPATHDEKILREALGTRMGSGWQVRDDQTDPDPEAAQPADPRPPAVEPAADEPPTDEPPADEPTETPAAVVAPETKTTTTKKGN